MRELKNRHFSRREFLAASVSASCAVMAAKVGRADDAVQEPIIDIHQHSNYRERSAEQLRAHQRAMGVTRTILLPSGSPVKRASTGDGIHNGLGGVGAGGNESVLATARQFPQEFSFGTNEVTDLPEARQEIAKYLDLGAIIIGEQKFAVTLDSVESQQLYALAAEYHVPILMHLQHGTYNLGFERLPQMLTKFPETIFIGHAQTWWANIDRNHTDQKLLYPKGPVVAGGLTDRYLSDYPNLFADMSAGSGLNALTRDEDHARGFLDRHQNKILYGSDCDDRIGSGVACQGSQTIAAIRKLAPNKAAERKILFENAKVLFRLPNG
ncbi:amidohydrolase family protein [Schlesneria paludicola]|uniref:amidohydrolase family protein n=1 Tax=Schlesneria paludicola TaxID=360056 RepID=UPI00029A2F08|nr:amidohydrolase [Schlesneria paludicola]